MRNREFQKAIRRLAAEAGLRHIGKRTHRPGDTWVGVCSGILVVMSLDSVRLHLELSSPDPDPGMGIEDDTSEPDGGEDAPGPPAGHDAAAEGDGDAEAFVRTGQAGIPADWFEQHEEGPWGFRLIIDEARRRTLAPECLHGLFHHIAEDLHDLGAERSHPCHTCEKPACTLGYFETHSNQPSVVPYCQDCWEATREQTGGVIRINAPVHRRQAWAALIAGSVCLAVVWGFAQHPSLELPFAYLLLGCGGAGFGLAICVAQVAGGSNLRLRLEVVAGVSAATLAGNILGLKLLLDARGQFVPWTRMVPVYFAEYFPAHLSQELWFLSGGLSGVLIGFFVLRATERMHVR